MKPLPRKDVAVNPGRQGPPRLNAADRQALDSIQDENLRRVLGEILLSTRATDENFKEVEQWFPVQPSDSVAPAYEGGGVTGVPFKRAVGGLFLSNLELLSGPGGVTIERKAVGTYWVNFHDPPFQVDAVSVFIQGPIVSWWSALSDETLVLRFSNLVEGKFKDYDLSEGALPVFFMAYEMGKPGKTIVGPEGPAGPTHKTLWNGEGAPAAELGEVDDFYIDTAATAIYGPKTEEGWGEPTSLIGPEGPAGADGADGPAGADGKEGPAGVAQVAKCAGNPGSATGTKTLNATECEGTNIGKIGAEGKLDGVTAAVGDYVMVFTGSIRDGLYEVVRAGGAAERWLLRRPDGINTAQRVERSRISVKEGTLFGHKTYSCDTTGVVLGTTELTFRQVANRDYGLVTALPTTPAPIPGDRCTFKADAGNGIFWNLVYDGEGTYPWKKIGGPPLRAVDNTQRTTTSTTYESLAGPLSVTLPLAGDYDIGIEFTGRPNEVAGQFCRLSYAIGATAATDIDSVIVQSSGSAGATTSPSKKSPHTGLAKSTVITEKAKSPAGTTSYFEARRLWVNPVRVG